MQKYIPNTGWLQFIPKIYDHYYYDESKNDFVWPTEHSGNKEKTYTYLKTALSQHRLTPPRFKTYFNDVEIQYDYWSHVGTHVKEHVRTFVMTKDNKITWYINLRAATKKYLKARSSF